MSTITAEIPTTARADHPVRRATMTSGVTAAAAVTALAAASKAAGTSLAVGGEAIPLLGFAQMTLVGAVLGGLLLAGLNRWADRPRRTFLAATCALTALSCVPSIALADDVATRLTLVVTHVVAAAVVVPVLARHAHR